MAATIFLTMIVLLLLGFPMMIPLIVGAFIGFYELFNGIGKMDFMVQQFMAGIRPASLIAVPMFIFAADIMTRGHSANRLIDMVMSFVGHIKGGLAVSTA
ncbi:MAG: TRAP transporter large permease subunit, partial [Oceanospirillales bacterium]|nr:TRAP transporter large permease subunit [Oceanospirillales bacterium]